MAYAKKSVPSSEPLLRRPLASLAPEASYQPLPKRPLGTTRANQSSTPPDLNSKRPLNGMSRVQSKPQELTPYMVPPEYLLRQTPARPRPAAQSAQQPIFHDAIAALAPTVGADRIRRNRTPRHIAVREAANVEEGSRPEQINGGARAYIRRGATAASALFAGIAAAAIKLYDRARQTMHGIYKTAHNYATRATGVPRNAHYSAYAGASLTRPGKAKAWLKRVLPAAALLALLVLGVHMDWFGIAGNSNNGNKTANGGTAGAGSGRPAGNPDSDGGSRTAADQPANGSGGWQAGNAQTGNTATWDNTTTGQAGSNPASSVHSQSATTAPVGGRGGGAQTTAGTDGAAGPSSSQPSPAPATPSSGGTAVCPAGQPVDAATDACPVVDGVVKGVTGTAATLQDGSTSAGLLRK